MAVKKKTIIIVLISTIAISTLFVSAWFYASYKISHMDNYKEAITKIVAEKINRNVTFETGKASLSFRDGLDLQFINIAITEKDRSSIFMNVKKAFFRVKVLPLLVNKVVFKEAILDEPRLLLKRDRKGELNIADLLEQKKKKTGIEFRKLTIDKGLVAFSDQAVSAEDLITSLDDIYCTIDSPFWGDTSHFSITASVVEAKNKAGLWLDGTYHSAPSEKPVYESMVNASIHLKGTDLKHYNPYLNKYTPVQQLAGRLDVETKYSGKLSDFTATGIVEVKDSLIIYPEVFRSNLLPKKIYVDYVLARTTGNLNLDVARLTVDNFEAKGSLAIKEMDKKDPLLQANAVTSIFSLKEVKSYIPWKIIHKGVGSFIEKHVSDGNFRLVEGKLNGRLSQIADMNKNENAGVIYVRAEVNKGVFEIDRKTPVFHDISGILELKNRRFSLNKMKGLFGSSPCTMEGYISDFALPQPIIYTADMRLQPARDEVLWLLGKEKFSALSFQGPSSLHLSGKGPDDDYHINVQWDLTDVAYLYPEIMEKPKTRKNQLTTEIIINKDAINASSFNYNLPPVNISGSALFRYSGEIPLSFSIKSKAFDVHEAVPILPILKAYNPAGTCSLAVAGSGDLSDPGSIQWKGNISLSNVSLKPWAAVKTVKGLTVKAIFKGNSMETSLFNAQIGESNIRGKFRIDDFRNPKLICQFNTDLLRTADFGLQNQEGEVNLDDVKGQIAIEDEMIHIENLSFGLGESTFRLSGDISDWAGPKITMALKSPYINSDDLARLMALESQKQKDDSSPGLNLNVTVLLDAGKFKGVDFKKLNAGLKYTPGIVEVEKLEADFFEGKIKAKGKVDIKQDGQNHYAANISVDKVSLEKIQRYLEMGERIVTGKLSLKGDVTASGPGVDDFKKTLAGTIQFRAEKGVLKKFSVLSKIFSLLNVYQLFKLQLPDMVQDGMPYNTITAHLSLKNGIVSSEDFLIDSDAMKISGAGKIDFLKKEVDYIAGIHPLQTLDRVAAKIPIAGWLITDEKGNLITVDFKVDGTWDNPNVSPIPAKSIARGTLDMFRRILQWPKKLITDPGEVIFGH